MNISWPSHIRFLNNHREDSSSNPSKTGALDLRRVCRTFLAILSHVAPIQGSICSGLWRWHTNHCSAADSFVPSSDLTWFLLSELKPESEISSSPYPQGFYTITILAWIRAPESLHLPIGQSVDPKRTEKVERDMRRNSKFNWVGLRWNYRVQILCPSHGPTTLVLQSHMWFCTVFFKSE